MQSATTGQAHRPLLIVQVDVAQEEGAGDYYYRAYAPGIGMARCESIYTLNLTNVHRMKHQLMELADVLILNNICDADILPVIRERKKSGKPTVYELADDLADMPASNPRRGFYSESRNQLLVKRLANYCDALQFSSEELQRKYGYLNAVSAVFPNNIAEMPPQRGDEFPETLVVGWGGSLGHFEDMRNVSGALRDWILSRKDVRLHLMCAEVIRKLFEGLPENRIKWFPPGSLQDYYNFVSTVHIGLGPLEDTAFNRSRSDVKFIEYAAHGVAPVLQATGPYLVSVQDGKTGFLYHSIEELVRILDRLAEEPLVRVEAARCARNYVESQRDQLRHGCERVEFYRRLLAPAGRRTGLADNHARFVFERCCTLPGAKRTGRNIFLSSTRFELLLTNGLMALKDRGVSRAMFEEAARTAPGDYMPYLFGASVSDDPIAFLEKAVRLNPRSILSWLGLAWEYGRQNNTGRARECFKRAAAIFPEYEHPYMEWARYANGIGRAAEAVALLKIAVGVIPEAIKSGWSPEGRGC